MARALNHLLSATLRSLAASMARVFFRFDVHGGHNIPSTGGGLIVCNHISLLDPFFVVGAVPRIVRFVMAQKLYDYWLWSGLMRALKMIPIEGGKDRKGLEDFNRRCRDIINGGELICIFPEGQITRVGQLLEFKKGIEHIAEGISAPIIPMQMEPGSGIPLSFKAGSQQSFGFSRRSFRQRITISIGSPLAPSTPSFMLRQKVLELQSETFSLRFRDVHTIPYFARLALKEYKSQTFTRSGKTYSFQQIAELASARSKELSGQSAFEYPFYSLSWIVDQLATILRGGRVEVIDGVWKYYESQACSSEDIVYLIQNGGRYERLSHKNVMALVKGLRMVYQLDRTTVMLGVFPADHAYGILFNLWLPFFLGAEIVLPDSLAVEKIADQIIEGKVTVLLASSEFIVRLIGLGQEVVWKSLRNVVLGRYPLEEKYMDFLKERGIRVVQSTGTIDETILFAVNSPDFEGRDITGKEMWQGGAKEGTVGRPVPGIAAKLVDLKLGTEIAKPDVFGSLLIKGAAVPLRKEPETSDGWVLTNYTASIDREGFITIRDSPPQQA